MLKQRKGGIKQDESRGGTPKANLTAAERAKQALRAAAASKEARLKAEAEEAERERRRARERETFSCCGCCR